MKYNAAYFIKKFKDIKSTKWTTGTVCAPDGRRCALGHCGATLEATGYGYSHTAESTALKNIADGLAKDIMCVNDDFYRRLKTPRARVLAFLRDAIKKGL